MKGIEDILAADLPQVEKLRQAFERITCQITEQSMRDIEVKHTLGDEEAIVHEQIKMESIKFAQNLLEECFQVIVHSEEQYHA